MMCIPWTGMAQNLDQIYGHYRQRLTTQFVHLGTERGDGIPAEKIQLEFRFNNEPAPLWEQSDGTTHLGFYLATLATEYAWLNQNGASTDSTLDELYYALNAVWRLDAQSGFYAYQTSDSFGCPPPTGTCKLSGCYVCHTCPDNPNFNLAPGAPTDSLDASTFQASYLDGFLIRSDAPCGYQANFPGISLISSDMLSPFSNDGKAKEMSQDQTFFLMMGLFAVRQLIPEMLQWNGVPLRQFAVEEGERIVEQLKGDGNWDLYNPSTGQPVERGASGVGYALSKARMGDAIIGGGRPFDNWRSYLAWPTWNIQRFPRLTFSEVNSALAASQASVGSSWTFLCWDRTADALYRYARPSHFRELYFLYYAVMHKPPRDLKRLQAMYLNMLNQVSPQGPASPWPHCDSVHVGWNTHNRFFGSRFQHFTPSSTSPLYLCNGEEIATCQKLKVKVDGNRVLNCGGCRECECTVDAYYFGETNSQGYIYNGLDFMLLYNLYRLAYLSD